MMDCIHKLITFLTSPLMVGLLLLTAGLAGLKLKSRRWGMVGVAVALVWMWTWSTPAMFRWLGLSLEMRYPPRLAEEMPTADAIAILGGGMGYGEGVGSGKNSCHAEMWSGADRVWHGARLWKAKRAPIIFATGGGVEKTTSGLLADLEVPTNVMVFVEEPRNTEEESRFIADAMKGNGWREAGNGVGGKPKVLVVTSAWHMRRAMLMFQRFAPNVEAIPAATDYETLVRFGNGRFGIDMFIPDANSLMMSSVMFKEHFAYWCYRMLGSRD